MFSHGSLRNIPIKVCLDSYLMTIKALTYASQLCHAHQTAGATTLLLWSHFCPYRECFGTADCSHTKLRFAVSCSHIVGSLHLKLVH